MTTSTAIHLELSCCCGAELDLTLGWAYTTTMDAQRAAFDQAHEVCRERGPAARAPEVIDLGVPLLNGEHVRPGISVELADGETLEVTRRPGGATILNAVVVDGRLVPAPGSRIRSGVDLLEPATTKEPE